MMAEALRNAMIELGWPTEDAIDFAEDMTPWVQERIDEAQGEERAETISGADLVRDYNALVKRLREVEGERDRACENATRWLRERTQAEQRLAQEIQRADANARWAEATVDLAKQAEQEQQRLLQAWDAERKEYEGLCSTAHQRVGELETKLKPQRTIRLGLTPIVCSHIGPNDCKECN